MKLAKNDLIWPVSHPRTMPIVYQMSTLFLIRGDQVKGSVMPLLSRKSMVSKERTSDGYTPT